MFKDEKYRNLEELSRDLGIEIDKKTFFEIKNLEEQNSKLLILKNGNWDSNEILFGVDEKNNFYAAILIDSLKDMIQSYKNIVNENFKLKLEKSIAQAFPVDFGDVWAVCTQEIKQRAVKSPKEEILNMDLDEMLVQIKNKHPNLFLNLDSIIKDKIMNEVV